MVDEGALLAAAWDARSRAFAPYSRFAVGAALVGASGRVWTGCNVESASYSLTCCAERVAIFKGVSEGERVFLAVAVVAEADPIAMPCGACRQVLHEFAAGATLVSASRAGALRTTVARLLPHPFDPAALPGSPPR